MTPDLERWAEAAEVVRLHVDTASLFVAERVGGPCRFLFMLDVATQTCSGVRRQTAVRRPGERLERPG
jgi:hypothetical protein